MPETMKLQRYARQFTVDAQTLADDALSAITETPRRLARAARRIRPNLVYYILLINPTLEQDSTALFHSDHGNTKSLALNAANLQTAMAAMASQTGDGQPLHLRPAYLIVPWELGQTARQIRRESELQLEVVEDDRLSAGVTDPETGSTASGSSSTWFLAADPLDGPGMEVAYLEGTGRRPDVTEWVKDGVDGDYLIGWSVALDIDAAPAAYQSLLRGNT